MINSVKVLTEIQENKVSLTTLGCVSSKFFNKLYKLGPLFPELMLNVILSYCCLDVWTS